MTPEQIKALAKQAIKNVGKPYYPDASSKISLFQEEELIEFVRLVRESDANKHAAVYAKGKAEGRKEAMADVRELLGVTKENLE